MNRETPEPASERDDFPPGAPSPLAFGLPIGVGIAYGLFRRGFVTHWAIEAVAFGAAWAVGSYLLRSWHYRAYASNRAAIGQPSTPLAFVVMQTVWTTGTVFIVAGIVIGIRRGLALLGP